jgi:predicted HicB family RNase H-like nuclease
MKTEYDLSKLKFRRNPYALMSCMGFSASIEYDGRDDILVGRVLGLQSVVSFHAESIAQLRLEFERSIHDYLAEHEEERISIAQSPPHG